MSETLHPADEKGLLERCRARDAGACQQIHRQYHAMVVQTIQEALPHIAVPRGDLDEMAATCLGRFCLDLRNDRAEDAELGIEAYLRSSGRYEAWRWVTRRRQQEHNRLVG